MTTADIVFVIACSAGISIAVGALAWLVLRMARRATIVVHLVTVVVAAVAAVVGGVLVAAQAMYISPQDVQTALVIAVTSGLVAIVTALLVGTQLARAARALRDAARDLGRGVPVTAAPLPVGEFRAVLDELAASDARLRAARDEIAQQEASRQELVVRIAHDLRVPLAGIRAQAEALQDGLAPDPDRYLAQIAAQVDRVNRLVDDLFAISRIDAGALALRREPTSLADLASDVIADLRGIADAAGLTLELAVQARPTVDADSLQLSRAIANLVANALQHTPTGGRVRVSVDGGSAGRALVVVADEGPGLAAADLEHAFEAGWRGSDARTPHLLDVTGGAGLGLAIVRGIARAHGGDVTAANDPAGGARFTLVLPTAKHSSAPMFAPSLR